MRFSKFLFLASILFASNLYGQDLKIHVNSKGKVGYVDSNGSEVIKCQYESAQPFKDGTAIVSKGGKSGIIDTSGKALLPLKYNSITKWSDNLYLIKAGKNMGLADRQGKVVLPVKYSHVSKPNCYGRALIAAGGKATSNEKKTYMANAKYGIIDGEGKILIEPKYKGLYEFALDVNNSLFYTIYSEGKGLLHSYHYTTDTLLTDCSYLGYSSYGITQLKAGILDGNGNIILKSGLYTHVMQPQSGMVRNLVAKKKKFICGYHNLSTGKGFQTQTYDTEKQNTGTSFQMYNGKPVVTWYNGDFVGDMAPMYGGTWSFIDKTGKPVRENYSMVKRGAVSGLWAGKGSDGKWEVFDEANNNVEALSSYYDINFPRNEGGKEMFSVLKDGKYGCVSRTGEVLIPFDYEHALGVSYGMIGVKKEGKWGFITTEDSVVVPIEYANIMLPTEYDAKHFWVMGLDGLFHHFDRNNNNISDKGYKIVENFANGVAHVVPADIKVNNTPVNRSQLLAPNSPKEEIDSANIAKNIALFGHIIKDDNSVVMDLPVSKLYKDKVVEVIKKYGDKPLTEADKKNVMLEVTKENRSYDLKAVISEDEWNY